MTINANADNGIKIKILVFRPILEIKHVYYKFVTFYFKQENIQSALQWTQYLIEGFEFQKFTKKFGLGKHWVKAHQTKTVFKYVNS